MANIILHDASGYVYENAIHIERISPFDVYRAVSFNEAETLVAKIGPFRALLTEPIAYKEPKSIDGHMQKEYRRFLENMRFVEKIGVIIYTSLSEIDATKEFGLDKAGLREGIHYDRFVSKADTNADVKLIGFLIELKKYTHY